MNSQVGAPYLEAVRALALGVEPIDSARLSPLLLPLMVSFDDLPHGHRRPPIRRLPSNRFVLLYDHHYASAGRNCDLRIFDGRAPLYSVAGDGRRTVPRRLRFALPTLAAAEAAPPQARVCRPLLYPGPAYPVSDTATGLRAMVVRDAAGGKPRRAARWVRVLATIPAGVADLDQATVIGRAFGDARGEFLLLLPYHKDAITLTPALDVRIRIFAAPEADPPTPDHAARDPLWDLPLEQPASLAGDDAVLRGEALPVDYQQVAQRVVSLPLGHLLRGQPEFLI